MQPVSDVLLQVRALSEAADKDDAFDRSFCLDSLSSLLRDQRHNNICTSQEHLPDVRCRHEHLSFLDPSSGLVICLLGGHPDNQIIVTIVKLSLCDSFEVVDSIRGVLFRPCRKLAVNGLDVALKLAVDEDTTAAIAIACDYLFDL